MNPHSTYENILTQSVEQYIPNWSELSPLDPMKIIVESFMASFTAIEKRQQRLVDTLTGTLPEFLGMEVRPARPALHLFRLKPRALRKEGEEISIGDHFQVKDEEKTLTARVRTINAEKDGSLLVKAELFLQQDWFDLGMLYGDAWEEISLPETLLQVPQEIYIQSFSGDMVALRRIQENILTLHENKASSFEQGFIYQGLHHKIVIPASRTFTTQVSGGVPLFTKEALLLADLSEAAEIEINLGELETKVETVEYVKVLERSCVRENATAYTQRFYQTLNEFHRFLGQSLQQSPCSAEELKTALLTNCPELRSVEIQSDSNKKLSVYALTGLNEDSVPSALQEELELRIPISRDYVLLPFKKSFLSVHIKAQATKTPSKIRALVESYAREALYPSPFGNLEAETTFTSEQLVKVLKEKIPELTEVSVVFQEKKNGTLLHTLTRQPGELFVPQIKVELGGTK